MGVDTDPAFLAELDVEFRDGVRFDEVVGLLGQARFAPVFHRPLFRHLGFVTNRTFETFYADTLPVLMLPRDFVAAIYGPAALTLVPGDDVAAHLTDALQRPGAYWDAVLKTRAHLAQHHSYAQRFQELGELARTARDRERRGEHPVRDEASGQRGQHARGRQLHARRAEVRPLGRDVWRRRSRYLPELQFSTDIDAFDRVAYLFESEIYRLKPLQEVAHARRHSRGSTG